MTTATVHPRPSPHGEREMAGLLLGPALMAEGGFVVRDFARISTKRGRVVVGRIVDTLAQDAGDAIQFDRFAARR